MPSTEAPDLAPALAGAARPAGDAPVESDELARLDAIERDTLAGLDATDDLDLRARLEGVLRGTQETRRRIEGRGRPARPDSADRCLRELRAGVRRRARYRRLSDRRTYAERVRRTCSRSRAKRARPVRLRGSRRGTRATGARGDPDSDEPAGGRRHDLIGAAR